MIVEILIIFALLSVIFISMGVNNIVIQLDRIADLINSTQIMNMNNLTHSKL